MPRKILFLILGLAVAVNLIGALSPEIGFDALWYHLTIPKLYLLAGKIYHIPGGLLYYSELPRLTEILYMFINPSLLSWGAGIGTTIVIYKLARKYLSTFYSLLSVLVFYVTPLVSWQSGSAYVDLTRTFFEVLALFLVLSGKPVIAGLAMGLAVSTKILALGSLVPLLVLAKQRRLFLVPCFIVILPWFLSAYLNTGYPFYPVGAAILDATHQLNFDVGNLTKLLGDFWKLWLLPEDPISPIYLIILPFLLVNLPKLKKFAILLAYCLLSYFVWFITPRTGGGRFILPYLPAFAILVGATVAVQKEPVKKVFVVVIIFISIINFTYRFAALGKTLPYFLGQQTKTEYLCRNLDTKVTFVDCDGWLARNLQPSDFVYIKGFHNLYYVNFPFVHQSWYRGEKYRYMLSP